MARSLTPSQYSREARAETGGSRTVLRRVVVAREHLVEPQALEVPGQHPKAPEVRDDGDAAPGAQLGLDLVEQTPDAVEDVVQALAARHPAEAVEALRTQLAPALRRAFVVAVVQLLERLTHAQGGAAALREWSRRVERAAQRARVDDVDRFAGETVGEPVDLLAAHIVERLVAPADVAHAIAGGAR